MVTVAAGAVRSWKLSPAKTQFDSASFPWIIEAVERYVVAVHLAWAYVERQHRRERSARIRCYGDVESDGIETTMPLRGCGLRSNRRSARVTLRPC